MNQLFTHVAFPPERKFKKFIFVPGASCYIFLSPSSNIEKTKRKRFWTRPSLKRQESYSINKLLVQLHEDDIGISGEIRSSFKNLLKMSTLRRPFVVKYADKT